MDQPTTLSTTSKSIPSTVIKSRSILHRVATGIGIALFAIFLVFLPGIHLPESVRGFPFALGIGIISIVAVSEFYAAVRRQGAEPSEPLGVITCILFQLVAWHGEGKALNPYLPAFLTMLVLAIMLVELVKPKQKPILNIGTTLLGSVYCGWLFSYLVLLHETSLPITVPIAGTEAGSWLVIMLLAITALNDSGALFVGSAIGRHKLAPNISPSKTWEGAVGGMAIAALVAAGFAVWLKMPVWESAGIGAILAVVGLIGDLCESAMKRELGVKDFGMILPGHGGFLDRVDSILFVAPVGYYLLMLMLHH